MVISELNTITKAAENKQFLPQQDKDFIDELIEIEDKYFYDLSKHELKRLYVINEKILVGERRHGYIFKEGIHFPRTRPYKLIINQIHNN